MGDDLDKAVEQGDDVGNVEEVAPGPPPRRVRTEEHGDAAVQTTPDAPDPVVHPPLRRGATLAPARNVLDTPAACPPARVRNVPGRTVVFETVAPTAGHRVCIFGPGGVGKTSLVDLTPSPIASFDLDQSLSVLQLPNTQRVAGVTDWQSLRDALNGDGWDGIRTICVDSITRGEEWAVAHTIKTVPIDSKGTRASSVESWGFGKGFSHVFDTFLPLLADLDKHVQAGRNVVLLAHECVTRVPNPQGEDWIRYEPRLQDPNSGKASIRLRVKEWCDSLLYLGYDVNVDRDGKGSGSGTRTLYPVERPYFMAKSRTLREPIVIVEGSTEVWDKLLCVAQPEE